MPAAGWVLKKRFLDPIRPDGEGSLGYGDVGLRTGLVFFVFLVSSFDNVHTLTASPRHVVS